MGHKRRSKRTSKSIQQKIKQRDRVKSISKDYISRLPDDILVSILSRLTIKEAATIGVLSRRWWYLWEHFPILNFDAPEIFNRSYDDWEAQKGEGQRFSKWVNHVLALHKSKTIKEFRVRFPLYKSFTLDTDQWLNFALSRKVQRLELDFSVIGIPSDYYAFPYKLYTQGATTNSFNSLKVLCLKYVHLGDEGVAAILSNFPFLERLTIVGNGKLSNIKLTGRSLKLKYLEVQCCPLMKSIEIFDSNLVSFKYMGTRIRLGIKNVPSLIEVYIGGHISGFLNDIFKALSCRGSQIENLTLELFDSEVIEKFEVLSELCNLKKFKVKTYQEYDQSLLTFTSLINAAPCLQEFVLESTWNVMTSISNRTIEPAVKCPHRHLRKVELGGYFGRAGDLELAMYVLENAIALEKMVVSPCVNAIAFEKVIVSPYTDQLMSEKRYANLEKAARKRAKQQLVGKAPAGVKLAIL